MKWIAQIFKEIIKSLSKLGIDTKIIITSLIALYPFWFLTIYFFGTTFYNSNPIWISLIISYCLTIVYCFAFLPISANIVSFFSNSLIFKDILMVNLINAMSYLGLLIYLAYYFNFSIKLIILIAFVPIVILQSIIGFIMGIKKAKDEEIEENRNK